MASLISPASVLVVESPSPIVLSFNHSVGRALGICFLCALPFLANYLFDWGMYYWQHYDTKESQIPPEYPSLIPFSNALWLVLDGKHFLERITTFRGHLTSTSISLMGKQVYFFQEREVLAKLWKAPGLSSPIISYLFSLKYLFGMNKKALAVYEQDNSGPFPKPYPGSVVLPHNRVDYLIHKNMQHGLVGPGLLPTTQRFTDIVRRRIDELSISDEWIEMPDFARLVYDLVGISIMEAVCGPSLLEVNPNFADDFWKFDKSVPWLARALPSFIIPNAHSVRKRLIEQLKAWHAYARRHFNESSIDKDGDGDRFWGSQLIRSRQKYLLQVDNQDDDSLASSDLGLIWASVSNILGASTWATLHIFEDPNLLRRVRENTKHELRQNNEQVFDPKKFEKIPLLASMYAETLRLYAKSYVIASSPYSDIHLGKWILPKGETGFVNSHNSHMDKNFWNTKDGLHPVDAFWAERFIFDPNDPTSGPVRAEFRKDVKTETREPFVLLEGLDSSWIPYGGGFKKCPGRFLAKTAVTLSCTLISQTFDIEFSSPSVATSPWKFGMGILRPKAELPFRIKKRLC